jgi:broad-specificity NMP kinase
MQRMTLCWSSVPEAVDYEVRYGFVYSGDWTTVHVLHRLGTDRQTISLTVLDASKGYVAQLRVRHGLQWGAWSRDSEHFSVALRSSLVRRFDAAQAILSLTGAVALKNWVRARTEQLTEARIQGRALERSNLNIRLSGSPGTGKTAAARLLARFFEAHGLCSSTYVASSGGALKAKWVGHTTELVSGLFSSAAGGCLFVDEVSGIGQDSFTRDALKTFCLEATQREKTTICILADYGDKMQDVMRAEPGLERRFPHRIELANYTPTELAAIVRETVTKALWTISDPIYARMVTFIANRRRARIPSENAFLALSIAHAAIEKAKLSHPLVRELSAADLGLDLDASSPEIKAARAAVQHEIDELVGRDAIKDWFEHMRRLVEYDEKYRSGDIPSNMNCLLTGNPGTGKTLIATKLARFMYAYRMVESPVLVQKTGADFLPSADLQKSVSDHVRTIFAEARGGCIFIDEASSMADVALKSLLVEVEANKGTTLVILADYQESIERLMNCDIGLGRRFPQTLHLEDYTADDIVMLAANEIRTSGYEIAPAATSSLASIVRSDYGGDIPRRNASLGQELANRAIEKMKIRVGSSNIQHGVPASRCILPEDVASLARPPVVAALDAVPPAVAREPLVALETIALLLLAALAYEYVWIGWAVLFGTVMQLGMELQACMHRGRLSWRILHHALAMLVAWRVGSAAILPVALLVFCRHVQGAEKANERPVEDDWANMEWED